MNQAVPGKAWNTDFPRSSPPWNGLSSLVVAKSREDVRSMVKENAVIVFGQRGCCMSHVVKRLLLGLGVNPAVCEVDEAEMHPFIDELKKMRRAEGGADGFGLNFPTVFIGGRWFGGLDRVMATHITGELTPILKQAGALWL